MITKSHEGNCCEVCLEDQEYDSSYYIPAEDAINVLCCCRAVDLNKKDSND